MTSRSALKTTLAATLGLTGLMLAAAPASAANKCIDTRDIVSSQSKDGRTMVFKMKDGTVLVNRLQGYCPDLKFNGFVWKIHGGDNQACERESTFQVIQSMQNCTLGAFDPPTSKTTAMSSPPTVWDANRTQAPR
jgi:hypothetical protein